MYIPVGRMELNFLASWNACLVSFNLSCSFCIVICTWELSNTTLNSFSQKLHLIKQVWRAHTAVVIGVLHPLTDAFVVQTIEIHQASISWNLLLVENFKLSFFAGTYYGQRIFYICVVGRNLTTFDFGFSKRFNSTTMKDSVKSRQPIFLVHSLTEICLSSRLSIKI